MGNQIDWIWKEEVDKIICMKDEAQRRHDAEERDAKMAKVQSENTELKSENTELKSENTELKSENTELKSALLESESEKTELKEQIQNSILSMIKDGLPDEAIMKYLGITFEKLQELKGNRR